MCVCMCDGMMELSNTHAMLYLVLLCVHVTHSAKFHLSPVMHIHVFTRQDCKIKTTMARLI